MEKTNKEYIGDGVYVSFDGYQIWLAVNTPDNDVVALEPEVCASLMSYIFRCGLVKGTHEGY